MKLNSNLKFPSSLDLGSVLPGHFGQSVFPLISSQVSFLTLILSPKSIMNGFFLLEEGSNDCEQSMNIVLKPGKRLNILVGTYPKQVSQSSQFRGQLIITQQGNEHRIKLHSRIQVPKIECKKMLEDTVSSLKMIRLVVNKAITSDVRIPLYNPQDYPLEFEVGLLVKSTITNKDNPFILKPQSGIVKAQPKQQFFVFINLQTNIGYKNDHKGLKKIVLRNVLTLKTNSAIYWCLPMQIIAVFIKQPQFKSDD